MDRDAVPGFSAQARCSQITAPHPSGRVFPVGGFPLMRQATTFPAIVSIHRGSPSTQIFHQQSQPEVSGASRTRARSSGSDESGRRGAPASSYRGRCKSRGRLGKGYSRATGTSRNRTGSHQVRLERVDSILGRLYPNQIVQRPKTYR